MGRVAIVGGSGNVAREVIDAILKRGNYEVTICSRKSEAPANIPIGIRWVTVDYDDHKSLVSAFSGIDTVLSFISASDQDEAVLLEKRIIGAAIAAGVRRVAPSQWSTSSNGGVAHYAYKDKVAAHLAELNHEEKVIEYSLFQPGFFVNYLAYPHRTSPHFHNMQMMFDFESRRAIVISGAENAPITLTSVSDMASVVAAALDFRGPWPVEGGMRGTQTTAAEIIALGEKIRGPFEVTRLEEKLVTGNEFNVPWVPAIDHPTLPVEMREVVSRVVLREYLLSVAREAWSVSDAWNKLLDLHLTSAEEFLTKIWK